MLSLIDAFQEGDTPEEIYQEYPAVSLGDVSAVIAFYLRSRDEVDRYLDGVREHEAQVIQQIKSSSPLAANPSAASGPKAAR